MLKLQAVCKPEVNTSLMFPCNAAVTNHPLESCKNHCAKMLAGFVDLALGPWWTMRVTMTKAISAHKAICHLLQKFLNGFMSLPINRNKFTLLY